MLILLINLPVVSALEISGVTAKNIAQNSATITWNTDAAADSFVSYGIDKTNLQKLGDAKAVKEHIIQLWGLNTSTTYNYLVESGNVKSDNSGSLYSFTTLAPDVTPPELVLEVPTAVKGDMLDVVGWTEVGISVKLLVDGELAGTAIAQSEEAVVEEVAVTEEAAAGEVVTTESTPEVTADVSEVAETDVVGTETVETETTVKEVPEESSEEANIAGAATSKAVSMSSATKPEGKFVIPNVFLTKNAFSNLTVTATDGAGNSVSESVIVWSDTSKPMLNLSKIPEMVSGSSLELNGTISESASYELTVNNKSVSKKEKTTIIKETVSLKEGKNFIQITVVDEAGWEISESWELVADSQPPTVTFEITKGNEYYQGRADSDVKGKTEPGANVYIYVYRPIGYEFNPDFKSAWAKGTADENGEFTFNDINFEGFGPLDLGTLENLAPKEVPADMQQYTIFPIEAIAEQQKWSYHVFVIAEDASGKSASAPPQIVTINTCYSGNFDFDVQSLSQFQAPLRLTPELVDQGREMVTALFNVSYRGDASSGIKGEPAYSITEVEFEKACTPGMMEDDSYKVGCSILPQYPKKLSNGDLTAWYITYNLRPAEKLSEKEDGFWKDFNKKRMIMFPLKVTVHYTERNSDGTQTEGKTQVSCTDLSYFADIPVDSSDMIPDFLADEGVKGINATINAINKVMPYLETAIKIAGISCVSSFTLKMVVRYIRIVTSKIEAFAKKECPYNQNALLLESERDVICGKGNEGPYDKSGACKSGANSNEKNTLDDKCPATAGMWKTETYLDQAYRWTCDRFFCRKVPAGWTEDKEVQDIESVILKQAQCTASSRGVPLTLIENCNEVIQETVDPNVYNYQKVKALKADGAFPCYLNNVNSQYYYREPNQDESGKIELEWIAPRSLTLKEKVAPKLFAFWPEGADAPIVGEDKSCKSVCKSRLGYKADDVNGAPSFRSLNGGMKWESGSFGCYNEVINQEVSGVGGENTILQGKGGSNLKDGAYSAGYTSDCFLNVIDVNGTVSDPADRNTGLLQCVCVPDGKEAKAPYGARLADKEETWLYRQADIFRTSKAWGTYYPTERYYTGRDFSSAFGADSLLDYIGSEKTEARVNPHTDITGTFQTVCLPGIRARLVTLRSILQAVQGCILDAKKNGLQDAGTCKTLFSQQVCGLLYKGIAYLASGCGPFSFQDSSKGKEGTLDGVSAVSSAVFGSIDDAMSSSIDEVTSDYTNGNLNEFFAGGAKGYAQSICMAAFGFDWPMGMDFIMDSAYAFPTASSVVVVPSEREFSTYNPSKGTAVYNYNLGVTILPGCKIKSADVYLKCVGQEDLGHPGVQCGDQGCDCLHMESSTNSESARTMQLEHGRMFDLRAGTVVDMGIPSPQKALNSEYRFDHVVVRLNLDRHEDAATCFDEGYEDGVFYFPLTDTSPPGEFVCQVDITSGRYLCPEIMKMFGGGVGAYFDQPDITCFDSDTESWASCDTPNLFVKGDAIKVRGNLMTDGGKYCLRMRTTGGSGLPVDYTELLTDPAGPSRPTLSLGSVTDEMIAGTGSTLTLASGAGCSMPQAAPAAASLTPQSFVFTYEVVADEQYRVQVPVGVSVHADSLSSGYSIESGYLTYGSSNVLTSEQIKNAWFNIGGLKAKNLVGAPAASAGTTGQCIYQIGAAGGTAGGYTPGMSSIRVEMELLQPDASGNCMDANIPLKSTGSKKSKATKTITIQMESTASKVVSKLYQDFMAGQYNMVQTRALQILNEKKANLEDAEAIFYIVASYIMQDTVNWKTTQKSTICNYMEMFFNRRYITIDQPASPYPSEVVNTIEFQKINQYLTEINGAVGCGISTSGAVASTSPATLGASASPTASPAAGCCADYTAYDDGTWKYKCLGNGKASSCRKDTCAIEKASFDIPAGHALQTACASL
jgi:hypothetical protein